MHFYLTMYHANHVRVMFLTVQLFAYSNLMDADATAWHVAER